MTIHPTGKCFDVALEFLHEQVSRNHALRYRLQLVHGICLVPDDATNRDNHHAPPGSPFAHAWIERRDRNEVIDFGLLDRQLVSFTVARGEYYRHYRVQVSTRYFVDEAIEHNHRSGHFGPWESTYRALCRDVMEASQR